MNPLRSNRSVLALILGVSLVLRLVLVSQGGQQYFTDEDRYDYGAQLYQAASKGDLPKIREIITVPAHAFFIWFCGAVVAGQHALAQLTRDGDWTHPESFARTLWLGASLLSLFSTLNLFLIYRLARNSGANETEARWTLLLMAASNTAFYYSRHFVPYDCALTAALGAVIVGTGRPTVWRAGWCGVLGGITYNTYNGYWYLIPIIWLLHAYFCRAEVHRLRLAGICAVSMVFTLAIPLTVGTAIGGAAYWSTLREFGSSAKLGLFAEGWSLPWEYFWHSEGLLGPAVVITLCTAFFLARSRRTPTPGWVTATFVTLFAAYALLVVFSNGLGYFVVYARTVKPFVPMFCLLGGWGLSLLLVGRPLLQFAAITGIVAAAALQFLPHYNRVFPRDVEIAVMRDWGNPKRTLSITGSLYTFYNWPVTRPDLALVNARGLYPIRSYIGYPSGKTLLRITHPLTYLPFQYECHTPRERALLRTQDISIRLIQLADPGALPNDPPMSMLYHRQDRPTGYDRPPDVNASQTHAP